MTSYATESSAFVAIFIISVNLESFMLSSPHLFETVSVTRLGDLLDFGQVLKAFGNNYIA